MENKYSIKLIASDLDGTLMAPDHLTVTPRTYSALKGAHDRGIKIAVATGRPLALIGNVIEQIPFTDYVIYSNGACVYDRNAQKNIYSDLIPDEKAREIVAYFLQKPVFFEVYIDGKSYYQNDKAQYFRLDGLPQEFLDAVALTMTGCDSLPEYMKSDGRGMEKITFYSVPSELESEFKAKLGEFGMQAVVSLPGSMEATLPTANKGAALKNICKAINATADEVMSFGDAGNDCPMLEFAAHSFAMQNGMDECKKAAKHIAPSNAQDGVAVEIEKYCL